VIESKQVDKMKKEFKIQTLYTGCEILHTYDAMQQPSDHYDTTFYRNIKNSFTITYAEDTLFAKSDSEHVNPPGINIFPFARYNDPDIVGDTIKMEIPADWYSYQKLKVNTGLIEYSYHGGHGIYYGISITLDSMQLK